MTTNESGPETFRAGGVFWRLFRSEATGMPLVILHGLFGSGDNWRSQARALTVDRPVLVPDMPNHGRSDHVSEMGYPAQARQLWDALEELGYGHAGAPISLLGHSMGGKTALGMAFARPEAIGRLVVVDIATREYPPRHNEIFTAMKRVAAAGVGSRGAADEILAELIPQKPIRLFLLKSLVPGPNEEYHWQLNLEGLWSSYHEIRGWPYATERFDGTVLLIAGGDSPYVTADDHRRFAAHAPNVRVETVEGAGHWLHADARDEFLSILRREIQ